MVRRVSWLVGVVLLALPVFAQNGETLRSKFNEMVLSAKSEQTAEAKRARLDEVFRKTSEAFAVASHSSFATERDRASLEAFQRAVDQKRDELRGVNGYQKVADKDLDAFAEYTVQDFEQADQWIYISTAGLVLIVLLLVLLLR